MVDEDERAIWLARHILPHDTSISRIIRSWRLPDGLDAEDIIQECYAKLAALRSVAHIMAPKVYFLQIARSVLLMHVRRARLVSIDVIANLDDLSISDDAPSPELRAADREQLRLLASAVVRMGEPHRTIFTLRMLHDLPYKAIGEQLGMSENAVQKALARTLESLAGALGRDGSAGARASEPSGSKRDRQS